MHRVTLPTVSRPSSLLVGPEVHAATDDGREPPYPGAIQDELAWHLAKYLREDARLEAEVGVEIAAGPSHGPAYFTMDLVVDVPVAGLPAGPDGRPATRRVAFEAGGSGRSALRDHDRLLRRDATVLAVGAADAVVRLRGSDVLHHMEDVLFLVAQWDPELFSERGRINLRTLASREARAITVRPEQPSVLVPYALDPDAADAAPERHLWHVANGQTPHVLVRRLDRRLPAVWAPYAADGFAPARLRRVEAAPHAEPLRKAG